MGLFCVACLSGGRGKSTFGAVLWRLPLWRKGQKHVWGCFVAPASLAEGAKARLGGFRDVPPFISAESPFIASAFARERAFRGVFAAEAERHDGENLPYRCLCRGWNVFTPYRFCSHTMLWTRFPFRSGNDKPAAPVIPSDSLVIPSVAKESFLLQNYRKWAIFVGLLEHTFCLTI